MKIWYQSASSYRYEPVWDEYGKTLEQQCKNVLRPDIEVYVTGLPVMVREIDMYRSLTYYHKVQLLNNMLKAEKEGYDAFIIGCTFDPGLEEGREMLNIPVVGISQASYHFATMLGGLFTIVSNQDYMFERYRQQIESYGLKDRYLQGIYYFPASEEELAVALKDPEPIIGKFKAIAEKAVADGASVIIPHPAFMATLVYKAELTKVRDTPVLDTVSVAAKTGEMLADLKKAGVEASRKVGVYGSPGKEKLREAFEKYAKVFKIPEEFISP